MRIHPVSSAMLFLLAIQGLAMAQSAAESFAKAMRLEIQNASAKDALPLYEVVAQDPNATNTLKARALYRQSICYLKLEEYKKAGSVLARLEKRYPQSDQAVQARLLRKTLGASEKTLAPRRDLTFEVQQLLVAGTRGKSYAEWNDASQAALKSLQFLGEAAVPTLRQALTHRDAKIRDIATVALVRLGDSAILDRLLTQANDGDFFSRTFLTHTVPGDLVYSLCQKKPALWSRVQDLYRKSAGRQKANLLTLFMRHRKLALAPDFEGFLDSENAYLRKVAWDAYLQECGTRKNLRPYFERLLAVWEAHPELHGSLASRLSSASRYLGSVDEATRAKWTAVMRQALLTQDKDVIHEIHRSLNPRQVNLPLRRVLIGCGRPKSFDIAVNNGKRDPEKMSSVDAASLLDPALDAIVEIAKTDVPTARQKLGYLQTLVGMLEPDAWARFVQRVVAPEFVAKLTRDLQASHRVPQEFSSLFSWRDPQARRRLPTLVDIATGDHPAWLQLMALGPVYGLRNEKLSLFDQKAQSLFKKAAFHFHGVSGTRQTMRSLAGLSKGMIDALAAQGRLSLEESCQYLNFSLSAHRDAFRAALKKRTEKQALTNDEVERLVQRKDIKIGNLITLLQSVHVSEEFRDDQLRSLWKRASQEERIRILRALQFTDANYKFIKDSGLPTRDVLSFVELAELDVAEKDRWVRDLWSQASWAERGDRLLGELSRSKENLSFLEKAYDPSVKGSFHLRLMEWVRDFVEREAVPLLIRVLDAKSAAIKIQACNHLASLADPRAAPKLIELLVYPSQPVRKAAENALESIKNLKENQQAWRDWFESMKAKKK